MFRTKQFLPESNYSYENYLLMIWLTAIKQNLPAEGNCKKQGIILVEQFQACRESSGKS